jgi:hypothetical protein
MNSTSYLLCTYGIYSKHTLKRGTKFVQWPKIHAKLPATLRGGAVGLAQRRCEEHESGHI